MSVNYSLIKLVKKKEEEEEEEGKWLAGSVPKHG